MTLAFADDITGLLMLLVGLTLSFLCSGMETGIYLVNKIRLDLQAEAGRPAARRLRHDLEERRQPLGALLSGNCAANYLATAGMVLLLTDRGWSSPEWCATLILTPLLLIFCELLPKNLFYRHAESMAYALSWFLRGLLWACTAVGLVAVIRGLIWVIVKLARRRLSPKEAPLIGGERIGDLLAEGRASGVLSHAQTIIADRIVKIGQVRLRDVMVPLAKATLVPHTATVEQVRQHLQAHNHARLGVFHDQRPNVIGVVSVYDVLLDAGLAPLTAHMASPFMLPDTMEVFEALLHMQQARQTMCFATANGRCVGLATMKDLVEEIVGELEEW
jgi:CBS domain containing-hemolysin-like protein